MLAVLTGKNNCMGTAVQMQEGCYCKSFQAVLWMNLRRLASDPAAWMCYKCQVKLKKLNEARNLVDEVSRLLSGLKRKADSDSVPLAKRPRYSVQPSICPDVSANS